MSEAEAIAGLWKALREDYQFRLDRFLGEVNGAWSDISATIAQVREAFRGIGSPAWPAGKIESLEALFADPAEELLIKPLRERLRTKPQLRVLHALDDLASSVEATARRLPAAAPVTKRELAETLGADAGAFTRWRITWSRNPREVALRGLVTEHFEKEALARARLDGRFQLLLSRISLELFEPWRLVRQRGLRSLESPGEPQSDLDRRRDAWCRRMEKLSADATRLLGRYRTHGGAASRRLARALGGRRGATRRTAHERTAKKLAACFDYWSRQQRAIQTILELNVDLVTLARRSAEAARSTLSSLEKEHEDVLGELGGVISGLESGAGEFPPAVARLVSAEDRVGGWVREMSSLGRNQLPATAEAVNPKLPLPGRRTPWRQLHPGDKFLRGVAGAGRRAAVEGFLEAETTHRAVVRAIERAREVVAYSRMSAAEEPAESHEVAEEGARNAIELLRYQLKNTGDVRPAVEAGLVRGTAKALLECHVALDHGRLGFVSHLARELGEQGATRLSHGARQAAQAAVVELWAGSRRAWDWLMYRLGLETPPEPVAAPVTQVRALGTLLEVELGKRDLPPLYRRLFRLEPVEDPRFLVGREAEMAGMLDARRQWEEGRAIAVLVVGARGSGKTSLLNCAERAAFEGARLVRGQFRDRVLSAAGMQEFLRELIAIPAGEDLVEALNRERRIVVLEEGERTFLRRMNGFEAIRRLLELVTLSWHHTLWVLSLNEAASRLLDAAAGLQRFFVCRINAMAVKPESLRNAILLRHNLSGYRLAFAPPAEGNPRVSRLRRRLGLVPDAADLFFEALYEQSEGIFRSAFELWQDFVERVEGGVLHLRQPVDPDYDGLLRNLTVEDCFTLQAIEQHGFLPAEQLAEVFLVTEKESRNRLERLRALEIVEPDPDGLGIRVRPEAGRLVRRALHRLNL